MPPPALGAEIPIGSTTISLGGIIGIAIGGAVVFIVIGVTAVTYVKRNHQNAVKLRESEAGDDKETSLAARANSSPYSLPLFATPYHYLPPRNAPRRRSTLVHTSFIDEDEDEEDDNIVRPGTKRSSGPKSLFQKRRSSIRDSWPLASRVQTTTATLTRVQSEKNIRINCVAPPGYVLSEPQRPKTTFSRKSPIKNSDSVEDITIVDGEPRMRQSRHRSNSENQLSSILKSTSQRLRDTHRQSVRKSWNNLGKFPGSPPKQRLPSPPLNKATESREVLLAPECSTPDYDSLQELQSPRTPSPGKRVPRAASRAFKKRGRSPTPSRESDDSLCGIDTPDLVIPAQLTSPSKSGRRLEQRHRMNLSPTKGSASAVKTHFAPKSSVISDPFFSSMKSAKLTPSTTIYGPQPRYVRKATFGQEEIKEGLENHGHLPLKNISGNHLGPLLKEPRRPPQVSELNPFQWSPKEAIQSRRMPASPNKVMSKRKGHKRSNVVRISGLSRPTSVSVVHEESEGNSPGMTTIISRPTLRVVEPSPSCTSLASRQSSALVPRPPFVSTFNPSISVPSLKPEPRQVSLINDESKTQPPLKIDPTFNIPPLKPVERHTAPESEEYSPTPPSSKVNPLLNFPSLKPVERYVSESSDQEEYSPTLSVCNYYAENLNSEAEFFKHARSSLAMKSQVRHLCQNIDEEIKSPDTPTDTLISFPKLPSQKPANEKGDQTNPPDVLESLRSGRPPSLASNTSSFSWLSNNNITVIRPPSPKRVSFCEIPSTRSSSPTRLSQSFTNTANNALALGLRPLSRVKAPSPLTLSSVSLPAPPLLSDPLPIPAHLTGPRPEAHKSASYSSAMTSFTYNTPNSTHDSIATSISLLRRMNSEISCTSGGDTDSSPMVPGIGLDWGDRRRMSRASRFYLSIGSPIDGAPVPNHRSSLSMLYPNSYSAYSSSYFPQGNDSSTSINSIGERRQSRSDLMDPNYGNLQEILEDINASRTGSRGESTRGSSPVAMGRHGLNVKKKLSLTNFTVLPDGGVGYMMDYQEGDEQVIEPLSLSKSSANMEKEAKPSKEKETRWSDAMIKPLTKTTRRESKMEHPSPQTPPKWGWSQAITVEKERLSGSPTRDKENALDNEWDKGRDSPESLGLYDQDEFLKSSPERKKVDTNEEKRGRARGATVTGLKTDLMEEKRRERLSAHITT
ncbi:hypothetical protein sscle_01g008220 [Sclerotinia sclerotiorum 1980 UF-70]|uniref:Uncharacterized protein n=1 Tax=Sclerotinia sclerotiorum (strain ATCC 18683 / 1980 / Ss-1) TaxID=665079 RepID=A0A1D9PU54_SCLS1|nr:hypothetical protein sscle_01g008220 [Sclerotinia sclerotiorum 1980 UF-70]